MKRTLRILLIAAAIMCLLCVSAFAADAKLTGNGITDVVHYSAYSEADGSSTKAVQDGEYFKDTVAMGFTYTDAAANGKFAFLVVSTAADASGINENNILYVNQYVFENGKIAPVIYPKSIAGASVYVSYSGSEGLKKIGEIGTAYTLGDVDNNGKINVIDLGMVAQYIAEMRDLNGTQFAAADVSPSYGAVNVADLSKIARMV